MSLLLQRLWRGLRGNAAATFRDADDPRLRGRTYAIPFEDVWVAACSLADGGLRGWELVDANDEEGRIRAESETALIRRRLYIHVRIGLDENGQTRVDLRCAAADVRFDLGASARRIHRFVRALDEAVAEADAERRRVRETPRVRAAG